jgi:hypothetical protein
MPALDHGLQSWKDFFVREIARGTEEHESV